MPTLSSPLPPVPAAAPRAGRPSVPALQRLRALPFAEYAALVARLLEAMGYRDVTLMGATHSRGRNAYGGLDIRASEGAGPSRTLAIAQVKQYEHPVPRSFVDELRGTALRLRARQSLLVTTGTFSRTAIEAARNGQDAAPVRLIAGNELVALLRRYGLDTHGRIAHRPAPLPGRRDPVRRDAETAPRGAGACTPPPMPCATPVSTLELFGGGVTLTLTVEVPPDCIRHRERP